VIVAETPRKFERQRDTRVTPEVGSEGGSPGNVELVRDDEIGVGSEAGETRVPAGEREPRTIRRDETGEGRRSP
jgi:hypothetical protein